jgi:formylglycine-generating enzyme required for sulfatase activity
MAAKLRQVSFTRFDALERGDGEEAWSAARDGTAHAQRDYIEASQALEAALAVDPLRRDVRSLFAAVIYDRALLAESERQLPQRDELVARLSLYDEGGELGQKWAAVARLAIETSPAGASVHLDRYVDEGGRLEPVSVADLGATPVAERDLPQGSYLLTLSAAGRATVRLPLLAGRSERLHLRIDLPLESAVPPGFVYVPPGRFLFGSAAADSLRRNFFETTPERELDTGAFLIGENEVTYAEWIRFLDALPPAERAARTPHVAQSGSNGSLELVKLGSAGWELFIQPGRLAYHARLGDKLRYGARSKRALQDWQHMPVTGISADDAERYLAWLRHAGRLPRARLCTELEWERAARGADGREFPHGNHLEPDDANFDETYGKDADAMGPDEVGSYPRSRSPFGVNDLVGNAFEWTLSTLAKDEYVARGGSSNFEPNSSAAMNRHIIGKTLREATLGLRVCADL